MKLQEIVSNFDNILHQKPVSDNSLNGLQVESNNKTIKRIAFAVDAGLSVIKKAISSGSELLVVHHGLLWSEQFRITGSFAEKLSLLLQNGCSLYASHLPLDSNLEFGNAAELARYLNTSNIQPFCLYKNTYVGVKASLPKDSTINEISLLCSKISGCSHMTVLPFGKKEIKNIGIVTGAGSFALKDSVQDNLDLLISGEPKHSVYHEAQELQMNAIFAGHYATETFGVKALMQHVKNKYHLETIFIDEPSGI
jgi:dinuclear metal center YbgI/SA1388 family protein